MMRLSGLVDVACAVEGLTAGAMTGKPKSIYFPWIEFRYLTIIGLGDAEV